MREKPWIVDIAALNNIADAVRRYRDQGDNFNLVAMFKALDRAENGMKRRGDETKPNTN